MDFRYTPEDEVFRDKVKAFLKKTFPENEAPPEGQIEAYRTYQRRLFDGGFAGIRFKKIYGGQEGTMMQEIILSEETAPYAERWGGGMNTIGHGMAGHTINVAGTEEQKEFFIPKLLDGSHIWCQGFSEPDAGSDAASIITSAVPDGDDYVVNGQKIWTSAGHLADWCLLTVRTRQDGPKHKGITFLLMDMKAPGVEVRPIAQITGEGEFNEVFMKDVRIPQTMRVGKENEGWYITLTTLAFERAMGDLNLANSMMRFHRRMIDMAKTIKRSGKPVLADNDIRQKIAETYTKLLALKINGYRNLDNALRGGTPGPQGSIGALMGQKTLNPKMTELAMEIQGPYHQLVEGSPGAISDGRFQYAYLRAKGNTIEAGTTEILRNIIGERVLGLPKDAARAAAK
ncbi:MAG: acyl-CoA dehydrogenase [Desulfobacteraceae bacterium]|nr:acyl-CoA dehydrogenase [Desulfobacteraceae bacterium]